ncbi:hypothetical protein [Undibacterium sp. TJN19]|uniref:hypothetical protein n=1 Tax=Undibacterium sp. TJN19 TaxID=3413055 RepID=UPI003BF447FE
MNTTWLPQLKQNLCLTAQGLVSAWTAQEVATFTHGKATTAFTSYALDRHIIGRDRNTSVNMNAGSSAKQSKQSNFKAVSNPISRIRSVNLQVAGAS